MGYNVNLLKVSAIPSRKAAAGTPVLQVLLAHLDQRITIPHLRVKCGSASVNLAVLQTEAIYRFTQGATANASVTVPGITGGLADRKAVIRDQNGDCRLYTIQSQTVEALVLDAQIPANTRCMLYLLGTIASQNTATIPLSANGSTVLAADCPGVITGKEIGWPVGLFLENADGNSEIEGGTIAFIGV